jgi:hypothetical protein
MMTKNERVLKRALQGYTEGKRPAGRPRGRWLDAVDRDAKRMLKWRSWRRLADDRDTWRQQNKEAKAQVGL